MPMRMQKKPLPSMPMDRKIRKSVRSPMCPAKNMPTAYAARKAKSTWPSRDCNTMEHYNQRISLGVQQQQGLSTLRGVTMEQCHGCFQQFEQV